MKKFKFNKLVRHKIPIMMAKEGVYINSTILNEEEYVIKLKEKLFEETKEVMAAQSKDQLKEELADVLEVIYSLADASCIPFEEVEDKRVKKLQQNGSFSREYYINYIEVPLDNKKSLNFLRSRKYSSSK